MSARWRSRCRPTRAANRGFLIDRTGEIVARYDKIHMFDVDLANGESYRESRNYRPGELGVLADLPWGRLGLTICYDLRFPALYRALAEAGATFLAIPSAFTRQTGEAHWHVLMRARAIENGCFVFAAAQGGKHENGRETFGHSLIVDPWGRILAEGGTEPGVVMAEIDPAEVAAARARIPSLQHGRRFEIVEPMAEPTHLHVVRRRRHDPLRARLRQRPRRSKAGSRIRRPTTSRPSASWSTCPLAARPRSRRRSWRRGSRGAKQARRRRPKRRVAAEPRPRRAAPRQAPVAMLSPQEREFRAKLKELREHLTKNADNVGAEISRGSAQDALRRDRASLDLRRGLAARRPRSCPRKASNSIRCRCCRTSGIDALRPSARSRAKRQPEVMRGGPGTSSSSHVCEMRSICGAPYALHRVRDKIAPSIRPHQQRDADHDQHDADTLRARVVGCLKTKREIACANSTSTSASVRTLAAVAMREGRETRTPRRSAPMKPANSDGRQARTIARSTSRIAQREIEPTAAPPACTRPTDEREGRRHARSSAVPSDRIAPR